MTKRKERVTACETSRDFHARPRAAILTAKQVLERFIDSDQVFLGGATALQARWHHRESRDLDVFSTGEAIDTLFYRDQDKMIEVLNK